MEPNTKNAIAAPQNAEVTVTESDAGGEIGVDKQYALLLLQGYVNEQS